MAVLLAAIPAAVFAATEVEPESSSGPPAQAGDPVALRLLESIEERALRDVLEEALQRNPAIAAGEARARAALQRAPQARALPDPVAGLTAFLATPETRTGPQLFSARVVQALPWLGKLELKEQASIYEAAAFAADVDARRLRLITDVRRLYYELGFLKSWEGITSEFRTHLEQHEEISRARYSTGVGRGQDVLKLQAAITEVDHRLLDIEARRVELTSRLNALRDRDAMAPLTAELPPGAPPLSLDIAVLQTAAERWRPELAAAAARVAAADARVELAEKAYRPDFSVGLTYTMVDRRDDPAGRLQPPVGNGDDIVGLVGSVTLPVRRLSLAAGVEEASELRRGAEQSERDSAASIRAAVGDHSQRLALHWQRLQLVRDLLVVQAEEALDSALAAYIAGTSNALDLLDAEHVLFEAHTAVARARADYLIGVASLEGAVAKPLHQLSSERDES